MDEHTPAPPPEKPKRPKSGGRSAGTPNRATREIRDITQKLFTEHYWKKIKQRLFAGELHPRIEALLLAYAYGEPKKTLEVKGSIDIKATAALRQRVLSEIPDDILRKLVEDGPAASSDGQVH